MSINQTKIRPLAWIKRRVVKKGRRPYRVRGGLFKGLTLNLDLQHQTQVYLGLWERETYQYLRKAAEDCGWMIDVGAGHGELCVFFLKHSRAKKVLAFEPQEAEAGIIKTNLVLNGEQENQSVTISEKFVGTAEAATHKSLDSLDLDKKQRGFIKVDVDGYEADVLKSGERLLSEGNVNLLVETHSKPLEDECIGWLERRGYRCRIIDNAWWRFIVPEQRPGTPHNRWLWADIP